MDDAYSLDEIEEHERQVKEEWGDMTFKEIIQIKLSDEYQRVINKSW